MTQAPQLLPTNIPGGRAPGVQYRIEGELVPVLHVAVDGSVPLYFEHHVILWKTPALQIGIKGLKGAFKRAVAGMAIFMTQTEGPGEVAFSRDATSMALVDPVKEICEYGQEDLLAHRHQRFDLESLKAAAAEYVIVGVQETAHRAVKRIEVESVA